VLAPATVAALPSIRAIETRSLPTSLAATHRGFAFYVAFPESSIPDRDVFYVARVPAAPFVSTAFDIQFSLGLIAPFETRSLPTLIHCFPRN
jgi:hypothetical protein